MLLAVTLATQGPKSRGNTSVKPLKTLQAQALGRQLGSEAVLHAGALKLRAYQIITLIQALKIQALNTLQTQTHGRQVGSEAPLIPVTSPLRVLHLSTLNCIQSITPGNLSKSYKIRRTAASSAERRCCSR